MMSHIDRDPIPQPIIMFTLSLVLLVLGQCRTEAVTTTTIKSSFHSFITQETDERFRIGIRPRGVENMDALGSRMVDKNRPQLVHQAGLRRQQTRQERVEFLLPENDEQVNDALATTQRLIVRDIHGSQIATIAITQDWFTGSSAFKVTAQFTHPTHMEHWGGGIGKPSSQKGHEDMSACVKNQWLAMPTAYYSEAGISLFFVVDREDEIVPGKDALIFGSCYPVSFSSTSSSSSSTKTSTWKIAPPNHANSFDMFVSFAPTHDDAIRAFHALTGSPRMPPLWALGFLASRWGWKDSQYIDDVLDEFDYEGVPIDGFIMDFEWYLNSSLGDYGMPARGVPDYPDFSFGNRLTFPDPQSQSYEYGERGLRMGGIRKPRLGDEARLAMALSKGWLLRPGQSRDLNFSNPDVRQYYASNQAAGFSQFGPSFWWNDEGETSYFTYHDWILAQQQEKPASAYRRFSLSRSFTPGMQRLEAAAMWTGDVPISWTTLRQHVDLLVQYGEAGIPLVGMDIGGFTGVKDPSPALLVRWYQLGIFAGVMRVHSHLERTAHFPLASLWGITASKAMHAAIRMRYSFLPTIYSLLHHGIPLVQRTRLCGFNSEMPCFHFANRTMIVIPIVKENSTKPMTINLPCVDGTPSYYPYPLGAFGLTGPLCQAEIQPLQWTDVSKGIPMFARAGSLLLTFDDVNTFRISEVIGNRKTVTVHIFPGANAISMDMIEDDGMTVNGGGHVRKTRFVWDDVEKSLSWQVTGENSDAAPRWFSKVLGRLYTTDGAVLERIGNLVPQGGELRMVEEEEEEIASWVAVQQ